jgi:hypothetical protein
VNILTVAGHLLLAWAVGLAATTAFLDLGPGLMRDHPPRERRITGAVVGPLALIGCGLLLVTCTFPAGLCVATPFALMAAVYSAAWVRGWRPVTRRVLGWQTGVVGVVSLLVLVLTGGPLEWHGGVVIAAYAASAGLLGGLTCLTVKAFFGAHKEDVELTVSPFGIPARVVSFGLGIAVLGAFDVIGWLLGGHADWLPAMGAWLGLSLAVPALLTGLGHKFFPRLQRPIWTAALVSAIGGQAAIHAVTLLNPGLIPPAIL